MRMKEKAEDHRGANWPRPKKEVAEQGMTKRRRINERGTQRKDSYSRSQGYQVTERNCKGTGWMMLMNYIFFRPLAIRNNYLKEKNLLGIVFLFQRKFTVV